MDESGADSGTASGAPQLGNTFSAAEGAHLMPRGYTLTLPDEDDFYSLKPEQLDELVTAGRSMSLEISLVCAGTVLGYIPSGFETVEAYYRTGTVAGHQIFFSIAFIVLAVLAVAKFLEHRKIKKKIDRLEERIKAGQKIKVMTRTA